MPGKTLREGVSLKEGHNGSKRTVTGVLLGIGWSRTRRSSVAGLGECRADGLERGRGARKAHEPWTGAGIWSAAGVTGGFEAPVVTGSNDLHSNDI